MTLTPTASGHGSRAAGAPGEMMRSYYSIMWCTAVYMFVQ
jgi:hypothetical protein